MSLGLPSFSMIFSGKAVSAIERSASNGWYCGRIAS